MLRGAFKIKMLCVSGGKLGVWVGRGCPASGKRLALQVPWLGAGPAVPTTWGAAQKWGATLSAILPSK